MEDNIFQTHFVEPLTNEESSQRQKNKEELRKRISKDLAPRTKNITLFGETSQEQLDWLTSEIMYIIKNSDTDLPIYEQKDLAESLIKEITSLGKISPVATDDDIQEIMINAPDEVWVEKKGELIKTDIRFDSEQEVLELARKIVTHVGRKIDNSIPYVDAHLPDGSRVHVIVPPLAHKGTTITIRKFFKNKTTINDLIRYGTINDTLAIFIERCVLAKANIIVNGGTGSGKTTTLNVISDFIPKMERVITIEDSLELQLNAAQWVRLESRLANNEGAGEVPIRLLVKQALRMRPDRIIVGEVRDGAAFDLMDAMNTGHEGSAGTVHSNSPPACVVRLDNLIRRANLGLDSESIKQIIADGVDIIIQISRLRDHSRKITHIAQVSHYEEGKVVVENLFEWRLKGENNGKLMGEFVYTGVPLAKKLRDKFEMNGVQFEDLITEVSL